MAELVAGAFLGAGVGAVLNELILLAKRAYRCKGDCKNLVATLESIQPLLIGVVQSSDCGNVTCQAWLQDLQSLMEKARDIVRNCDKDSKCSYMKKFLLSSRIRNIDCRIHGKVMSEGNLVTLNIIQGIDCKVTNLSAAPSALDQPPFFEVQDLPSHIVAFNSNPFKKLKELILSVPPSVTKTIGLKGGGGAGKTLLAKMVNNDEDIQKKYGAHSILWITVGQDVLISSVYKRMGKFLDDGGVFERDISGRDLEAQRTYLLRAFKQKRALIILDDMWGNTDHMKKHAMIYWLDIFKGDGSTTLITTRDSLVLDRARAVERVEVQSLSKEESWKLFSFHAFQANIPSREVKDIAMEICNECKGLPLALEVIGGALWDKKDESDWKYALSRLQRSEPWSNLPTMEDELFHCLKYSYDVLDEETKKCFLYFAAFPEDYWVPMEELCSIWRVDKLFGPRDVEDTMNTGRMNLITLADRSLIDFHSSGFFKIHDVLRDLAIRIIRDAKVGEWAYGCQFEVGRVLETLPKIRESTKRVSFMGSHIKNYDPQSFVEGYNVEICLMSALAFDHGSGFANSLPEDFFSILNSLMHLDLRGCRALKELPESIKELKSLTHLDLGGCRALKELPESIKELKSLSI